eukprot:gene11162-18776_t
MAASGAALQNHNNERRHGASLLFDLPMHGLLFSIDDLREKREEITKQLTDDEKEKAKIQQDLQSLTKRLGQVNESIAKKNESRNEYDKVIAETEGAYMKILESSQTLLTVLKRETVNISKKKQASS